MTYTIGIDPGTHTGLALWDSYSKELSLHTFSIIEAIDYLDRHLQSEEIDCVFVEDAHKRVWFGKTGRERLQGAGSVKRDCNIWVEYCKSRGLTYKLVAPMSINTRMSKERFRRITGYSKNTSVHSRVAGQLAMLNSRGR